MELIYGKIIEENHLEGAMHIGLAKPYIKRGIEGQENGLKMTEEEKAKFIELGIMERVSLAQERLEILETLKQNGVNITKISVSDTIGTISQEGIDIEKIIEDNYLDASMKIGDIISKIKLGMKENPSGLRMTKEEKEKFLNLGINPVTDYPHMVQKERKRKYLTLFTVLKENGIDVDNMKWGEALEDYTQEGLDIKDIIDKNSLDGKTRPKDLRAKIIRAIEGKEEKYNLTEEEIEDFRKIGIFPIINKKSRAQEYIEIFTILKENGVDLEQLRKIGRDIPLKHYNQDGIDIGQIVEENKLDGNIKIAYAIKNIKSKTLKMTDEEIKVFEYLGIIEERPSIIEQHLKLLTILKDNGIQLNQIKSTVEKLSYIEQEGINIQEIIESNELDGETKIGSLISRIRATLNGSSSQPLKITEEEKKAFQDLELFDEEKTVAQQHIELLSLLTENGIELKRIKTTNRLKDIKQRGIDIQAIIEENDLDESIHIGNIKSNLRRGIEGKKNGTQMTEEEKQKLIEMGILDTITKAEEYLELFTILKDNGVDIVRISRKSDIKLKDIRQKGIDIERIIRDNDLDGKVRVGDIKQDVRATIRGEKVLVKMTDEQKQQFIKLGFMEYRQSKAQECLRICSILKENGVDLRKIRNDDKLEDIIQKGIDIRKNNCRE
ncbi:MAG: hypothetical protein HFJ18_02275 [Clostridia bacterium]|nr:hypothetical protein [Clostridia bacterium]